MDIISFMIGFKKGKGAAGNIETQEKTVSITTNGATEVLPDDGYALSKVTVNTNVESSGGEFKYKAIGKSITGKWGERVSVDFGFKPKFLMLYPFSVGSIASSQNNFVAFGISSEIGTAQNICYIGYDGTTRNTNSATSIDGTDQNIPIYAADATGFNLGKTFAAGTYYVVAIG